MNPFRHQTLLALVFLTLTSLLGPGTFAQSGYPSKPVRINDSG